MVKTRGSVQKAPDLSITRMAPMDAIADPIWKWFNDIRDKGFTGTDRVGHRKNGSIVLYDTAIERGRPVQLLQRLAEQDRHRRR